ncbi:MAG TPA: molybdenum cofactor biosynthesis protein MoaE [Candidatus Thermoplasmatota archaeon]|nr:molybdenum cofactor biosynthesis protein MoaE [Candidatus Thermoplasmatota archaeon]
MSVRVRFFAGTRDAVGAPALDVDVPEGARVDDVMTQLCATHPRLAPYRAHALYALDGAFVPVTTRVAGAREMAVMPPVSGGSLQEEPFSLDALVHELERAGAGAVVGFVGYVRGDGGTTRLRFEAYAPMAEREIAAVRDEAMRKFGLTGCLVRHRIATLAVGEPIVAVVTAAPHRLAAFEAAQWIMDELKTRVPIWKAEESGGGARWVNDPTGG